MAEGRYSPPPSYTEKEERPYPVPQYSPYSVQPGNQFPEQPGNPYPGPPVNPYPGPPNHPHPHMMRSPVGQPDHDVPPIYAMEPAQQTRDTVILVRPSQASLAKARSRRTKIICAFIGIKLIVIVVIVAIRVLVWNN